MGAVLKSATIVALFILVSISGLQSGQDEPSPQELQKLKEKWLTVESWSASYKEIYTSDKTWEMQPGMTTRTTIHSTISGTYKLEKLEDEYDDDSFGEWYGYGNGSSIMDQTVVMTYRLPEGTIIITEKTHTASSGAIGDPSKNEYGEFWGGGLEIDIYSGTYSFGFGGPESDGKSTFTRTVEGLTTDYSDLENLPEGLREIFVPLGDKAEEWATYSGPLEDAPGISVGGLAGFELFPDMDEPKEYELPKSGMVLHGSYSGKNVTKSWTIFPTGMEMPKVLLEIVDKDWVPVPKDKNTVGVKLSWENITPSEVEFTLFDISKEPGICLNSENDNTDPDMDIVEDEQSEYFDIRKSETQIIALHKNPDKKELTLVINSLDYGAYAKIKARIHIGDIWYEAEVKELGGNELRIPFDKNENHMADKWEKEMDIFTNNYQPEWDEEENPLLENDKFQGDGLSLYEEYRGLETTGENGPHVRLDPNKKELIVENEVNDSIVKPGIDLFEKASKIKIVLLKKGELPTSRIINSNHATGYKGDQHGIIFKQASKPDTTGIVGECHPIELLNKKPKDVTFIRFYPQSNQDNNESESSNEAQQSNDNNPPDENQSSDNINGNKRVCIIKCPNLLAEEEDAERFRIETIAHEIGHAVGLNHHGDTENELEFIVKPEDTGYTVSVYNKDTKEYNEIKERPYTICCPIGRTHNGHSSGSLSCIMRYNNLYLWRYDPRGGVIKFYEGEERSGALTKFCTSDDGGANPFGNAGIGKGNCLGRLRVKDY